jgi:hypothetical protein
MVRHPFSQCALESDVMSLLLAQNPFAAPDLLALGEKFLVVFGFRGARGHGVK